MRTNIGDIIGYELLEDGRSTRAVWATGGVTAVPPEQRARMSPRNVARTILPGWVRVSTSFLGLDHNWSDRGRPLIWETMVFFDREIPPRPRPFDDEMQWRESTWARAMARHRMVCSAFLWPGGSRPRGWRDVVRLLSVQT